MNISKHTAEKMLANIEMQLKAFASEQQTINGNVGGKMRKGGVVKQKMVWGDIVGNPLDYYKQIMHGRYDFYGHGTTPTKQVAAPVSRSVPPIAVSDENLASLKYTAPEDYMSVQTDFSNKPKEYNINFSNPLDNPNSPSYNPSLSRKNTQSTQPKTNDFWANAMGLAPSIFNGIAGLTSGKADVLNPEAFQNPYESQSFSMMPDQYRIDDILNDNRNAYSTYLRNVNQVGNSRGERMANYTAGMNRMNESNTKAWALKNNMENEMKTNKAQLRNNQGNVRAGVNLKVTDMNDANKASSRNRRMAYLGAAATGAQTYSLTNKQMGNQAASQDAYINALLRLNPYMSQWLGMENYNKTA